MSCHDGVCLPQGHGRCSGVKPVCEFDGIAPGYYSALLHSLFVNVANARSESVIQLLLSSACESLRHVILDRIYYFSAAVLDGSICSYVCFDKSSHSDTEAFLNWGARVPTLLLVCDSPGRQGRDSKRLRLAW